MLAPKELKAIHPLGKSPTVVIKENGKETTLAESGAIVEYLVERYGKGKLFVQPDSPDRAEYLYWLHYAEGSFMLYGILTIILKQIPKQSCGIASSLALRETERGLQTLDCEAPDKRCRGRRQQQLRQAKSARQSQVHQ